MPTNLYYVLGGNRAIRYRVGVGEVGRTFAGRATVGRKQEWPSWTPTANMIRIEPELYGPWAGGMEPGLENPLGARAMYLYRGGRDTMYRIHGTYAPSSIGNSVSAGCIRMFQQDAINLFGRVRPGTRVRVLGAGRDRPGTVPLGGGVERLMPSSAIAPPLWRPADRAPQKGTGAPARAGRRSPCWRTVRGSRRRCARFVSPAAPATPPR